MQDVQGGKPRAVTAEGTRNGIVSPDGALILVQGSGDAYLLSHRMAESLGPFPRSRRTRPWSAGLPTAAASCASRWSEVPGRLDRVDLATGRRDFVRRLAPPDLAGVVRIRGVTVARDETAYAYSIEQLRSDLFLVEGAR